MWFSMNIQFVINPTILKAKVLMVITNFNEQTIVEVKILVRLGSNLATGTHVHNNLHKIIYYLTLGYLINR